MFYILEVLLAQNPDLLLLLINNSLVSAELLVQVNIACLFVLKHLVELLNHLVLLNEHFDSLFIPGRQLIENPALILA
jgi:hypothetical protein